MTKFGLRVLVGAASLTAMAAGAYAVTLTAAGATFPYPIYGKWFGEFKQKTGSEVNYQSIGSSGGITQLMSGTVDFGASDKPMTDEQIGKMKVKPLHFPTVLGAVVPVYNVEGVAKNLNFTGEVLAGIFMGTIKKWNDAELTKVNPGVKLPDAPITVVVRSEGSGTTFVFTDYLAKVSPTWKSKIGADAAVDWPVGLRAKGNEGVSGEIKRQKNSIGYVELIYAIQQKMGTGNVKNSSGKMVLPNLESVTAAAAGAAKSMPDDFRVSITNAPGATAYPISSFTWLLIPSKFEDAGKRKIVTDFLAWMLTEGQKECASLGYAPLPASVVAKEKKQIAEIR